jgi:hypothetical protein
MMFSRLFGRLGLVSCRGLDPAGWLADDAVAVLIHGQYAPLVLGILRIADHYCPTGFIMLCVFFFSHNGAFCARLRKKLPDFDFLEFRIFHWFVSGWLPGVEPGWVVRMGILSGLPRPPSL